MAKLIALLSSLALLLAAANTAQSQSASTSFTYDFLGIRPNTLTYQSGATIPADSTYLRLTGATLNTVGRALHTAPVLFKGVGGAQADFETTVKFLITPAVGATDVAEGLTFFMGPVGTTTPESSFQGHLAIYAADWNARNTLVVEFDTFPNADWDPSYPHVGINLGNIVSSNVTDVGTALVGQEVTARINYVAATKVISVRVAAGAQTFEVSYVFDLGNLLNDQVQVGLSASTGYVVANHDVVAWYFTSTIVNTNNNIRQVV